MGTFNALNTIYTNTSTHLLVNTYICYTYIRTYGYTYIQLYPLRLWPLLYFASIYLSISASDFDLTFHPLVVFFDFYSAKVSQTGNTANNGMIKSSGRRN
ncbi:hypothetical protein [Hoylesella saccharolytica]|uniref:hypothetical protein n=1 Tax=Hoylesella saccharolytica TaxID=633701 RepID=UPI0028D8CD71|nr:hypothetical protein [Hoylesella saccharolytica]